MFATKVQKEITVYDRRTALTAGNLQSPELPIAEAIILPPGSLEVGLTNLRQDGHRMAIKINGTPLEVLAAQQGIDITTLNKSDITPEAYKTTISKILTTAKLSAIHISQLESFYEQWLIGHISLQVKHYFNSRGRTVYWMRHSTNVYEEGDSLKLKAEITFSYVVDNETRTNIDRLNASARSESVFIPGRGFILEKFHISGEDAEKLAQIYALPRNTDLMTGGPTLKTIPSSKFKEYLIKCITNSNLYYPNYPLSSHKLYNILALSGRPIGSEPILLTDFFGAEDGSALREELATHMDALNRLDAVATSCRPYRKSAIPDIEFKNELTRTHYSNFPARAKHLILLLLCGKANKFVLSFVINQQQKIIAMLQERFASVSFSDEFKQVAFYMHNKMYEDTKPNKLKEVDDLQTSLDTLLQIQSRFSPESTDESEQALKASFEMLLRLMWAQKLPAERIRKITHGVFEYTLKDYTHPHLLKRAGIDAISPWPRRIESDACTSITSIAMFICALGAAIGTLVDMTSQNHLSHTTKMLWAFTAPLIGLLALILTEAIICAIHALLLPAYKAHVKREAQPKAPVDAIELATLAATRARASSDHSLPLLMNTIANATSAGTASAAGVGAIRTDVEQGDRHYYTELLG